MFVLYQFLTDFDCKTGQIYNYIQKCRRWIPVWRPRSFSRNKEFSITTYNILAQNLLLNHLYLYRDNIKSDLEWCERSNRLKNELIELNSDIFCLQEFNIEHFNNTIWPSLKDRGYQMVFKQKTGNNLDGCSILFKKSKFQLQGLLELEMNRSDVSHLLDRDQVALVVKLRPNCPIGTNATNLIIANTHLLFNPKRGDIKLAQLRLLLAEIQRFAINNNNKGEKSNSHNPYQLNYFPIIVCGDFNSEPNSPLINFMQTGKFNFHGIRAGDISGQRDGIEKGPYITRKDLQMMGINSNCCYDENNAQKSEELNLSDEIDEDLTIKHVFNLKSVYPSVDKFNLKLISTSTYYDCGLVDYLFYSHKHQNLHLSAFKQLINKQNLKKIGTIPNSILGSDHLSLSAKFYLT